MNWVLPEEVNGFKVRHLHSETMFPRKAQPFSDGKTCDCVYVQSARDRSWIAPMPLFGFTEYGRRVSFLSFDIVVPEDEWIDREIRAISDSYNGVVIDQQHPNQILDILVVTIGQSPLFLAIGTFQKDVEIADESNLESFLASC